MHKYNSHMVHTFLTNLFFAKSAAISSIALEKVVKSENENITVDTTYLRIKIPTLIASYIFCIGVTWTMSSFYWDIKIKDMETASYKNQKELTDKLSELTNSVRNKELQYKMDSISNIREIQYLNLLKEMRDIKK